jgi:hypothetical protein
MKKVTKAQRQIRERARTTPALTESVEQDLVVEDPAAEDPKAEDPKAAEDLVVEDPEVEDPEVAVGPAAAADDLLVALD